MKKQYNELDIQIRIDNTDIRISALAYERLLSPTAQRSLGTNSYELHYIPHGSGTAAINGQVYEITPNTLYVIGPHITHEQAPAKDDTFTEYRIRFQLPDRIAPSGLTKDTILYKFIHTPFWFGQDAQELLPVLQELFSEFEHKYKGYMISAAAFLELCIVKLVRNYENRQQAGRHFSPVNLSDNKYIIAEESFLYEFETLKLDTLAARLGLGTRQTERFLKDYYGKTFLQKKNEAKMSMAKLYLDDDKLSITTISDRLNYSTPQHFSHAFKEHYGITPSGYRKRKRAETISYFRPS